MDMHIITYDNKWSFRDIKHLMPNILPILVLLIIIRPNDESDLKSNLDLLFIADLDCQNIKLSFAFILIFLSCAFFILFM